MLIACYVVAQNEGLAVEGTEHDEGHSRLALVAHELRGPMAVVDHSLLLLERELGMSGQLSPRAEQLLGRLRRNTSLATRIVGDLMEVARFDLTDISLRRDVVDLVLLIEDVIASLETSERQRVTVRAAPVQAKVSCDPERIFQVFYNLVRNALQYGHGPIEIRVVLLEGVYSLSFENEGDVAAELAERAFRPFTRGTHKGDGLGLGLYIVHRLIHAHAGTTSFQASDGRVRVTVLLPLLGP